MRTHQIRVAFDGLLFGQDTRTTAPPLEFCQQVVKRSNSVVFALKSQSALHCAKQNGDWLSLGDGVLEPVGVVATGSVAVVEGAVEEARVPAVGPVGVVATGSVAVVEGAVEAARVPADADETLAGIIVAVAGGAPVGDDVTRLDWFWL